MIRMGESTFALRMVGTGIDRVYPGPATSQRTDNRILHGSKFVPAIVTVGDARLISDHDHRDAPLVCGGDYFRTSRNYGNVVDFAQIAGIFHDRAITVQKQS